MFSTAQGLRFEFLARSGRNFTYLSGIAYPGTANDRTIRDGCARDAYDQTSVIPPS